MRVITAPEKYEKTEYDFVVFLAGGINKCPNWQREVRYYLEDLDNACFPSGRDHFKSQDLVICNPRRSHFPFDDPSASKKQIEWEYKWLNECDLMTMNFCESESDQPICMYELGKYALGSKLREQHYPIINTSSKYKRFNDVIIQTELASRGRIRVNIDATMREYAIAIYSKYLLMSGMMDLSLVGRLLDTAVIASHCIGMNDNLEEESDDQNRED